MSIFNKKSGNAELERDMESKQSSNLIGNKGKQVIEKVKTINKDEVEEGIIKVSKKIAGNKVSKKIIKELDKKGINRGMVARFVEKNKIKTKAFVDKVCNEQDTPVGLWVRPDLVTNTTEFRSTTDGHSVSSYVLQEEFNIGEESPVGYFSYFFLAISVLFPMFLGLPLVLFGSYLIFSAIGTMAAIMSGLFAAAFVIATSKISSIMAVMVLKIIGSILISAIPFFILSRRETKKRKHFVFNSLSVYAGVNKTSKARLAQAEQAWKDKTTFIPIGYSTGALYKKGSEFSPKHLGEEFGLSMHDMSVHLHVFGESGTGKTAGMLTPLIKTICDAETTDTNLRDFRDVKFMIKQLEAKYD